mgnify:CR=1 FL=1
MHPQLYFPGKLYPIRYTCKRPPDILINDIIISNILEYLLYQRGAIGYIYYHDIINIDNTPLCELQRGFYYSLY